MKMRTTAPSPGNKYYTKTSYGGLNKCILINSGNGFVIPNCVGYAYGRFMEEANIEKCELPMCNAEDWYENSKAYEHGKTPRQGAVMCWRKGRTHNTSDGAGHVCIVEEVFEDGSVRTSESNYGGTLWFSKIRRAPYPIAGQSFQGFIYNPYIKDDSNKKSIEEIAQEVIQGKWGNGEIRKAKLKAAGYDYNQVQEAVNNILRKKDPVEDIAREVIQGKWGNGFFRKMKLQAAGYDYKQVQEAVNKLLRG